jgi:hypothetical protein
MPKGFLREGQKMHINDSGDMIAHPKEYVEEIECFIKG